MTWANRGADRRQLRLEFERPGGRRLLSLVLARMGVAVHAPTWSGLDEVIGAERLRSPVADEVLRSLLAHRQTEPQLPWSEALLLLFWDRLLAIHCQKRRWDRDDETRWSNIQWCFIEAIHRIDPARRPARLGQKILNDTTHHLHDHYAQEWRRGRREPIAEPEEVAALADPFPGIDFDGIELRQVQRSEVRRLGALRARGRISDADYFLQVGTRIYGRDLAECAAEVGLGYDAAKKRCQRIRARVDPNRRR